MRPPAVGIAVALCCLRSAPAEGPNFTVDDHTTCNVATLNTVCTDNDFGYITSNFNVYGINYGVVEGLGALDDLQGAIVWAYQQLMDDEGFFIGSQMQGTFAKIQSTSDPTIVAAELSLAVEQPGLLSDGMVTIDSCYTQLLALSTVTLAVKIVEEIFAAVQMLASEPFGMVSMQTPSYEMHRASSNQNDPADNDTTPVVDEQATDAARGQHVETVILAGLLLVLALVPAATG